MSDARRLAITERSRESAIESRRQAQRETAESRRTVFTGNWLSYDSEQELHRVRLEDGSIVWCESDVPTGFQPEQAIAVSRPKGALYGRIRTMR